MKIIGAGLAGLLAANMLRKSNPTVYEQQASLPNNHTALLRHRENKISEATSIPFKKVKVQKAIAICDSRNKWHIKTKPNIRYSNMYSFKVTGGYESRSISNLDPVERYIAPPDFIRLLSLGTNIIYSQEYEICERRIKNKDDAQPIISTMPMPVLAEKVGYEFKSKFQFKKIVVCTTDIVNFDCDIYQTVYHPDPSYPLYRVSITGKRVIMEFIGDDDVIPGRLFGMTENQLQEFTISILQTSFGIYAVDVDDISEIRVKHNNYGKIKDIDDRERKDFIKYMTDHYNVYSLGRYAIWKNILLDDVHKDILVIKKLIQTNGYFTG